MWIKLLVCALTAWMIKGQLPEDDEVDITIPGYKHRIYSGYLDIGTIDMKKTLHYVLQESQNDVSTDPLLLVLTGGPGCSAINGMVLENGPFIFKPKNDTFTLNPNAWNKQANVLYFQLPAGVGFSEAPANSTLNDTITTDEAITGMRRFFIRFPTLKKNELYLFGRGYGAVHANYIATEMLRENADPFFVFYDKFNLKGVLLGNPCIRPDECYASGSEKQSFYHYEYLYRRAFYAKSTYNQFLGICAMDYHSYECYQKRVELSTLFNNTNTSIYNIYDICYYPKNNSINTGCLDEDSSIEYWNDDLVREEWNINKKREELQWTPCNKVIWDNYIPDNNSYHLLHNLMENNIRMWVVSGDLDASVPIIGTKKWLEQFRAEFELPIQKVWREWWVPGKHKGEDQVGGFIWELEGITFATIKGAGFRFALDQPVASQQVLAGFLSGKTLPYKS